MHVRKPIQDNSSGTITNNTRLMAPHKNQKVYYKFFITTVWDVYGSGWGGCFPLH